MCGVERRGVVDAVPHEADHVIAVPERGNDPSLLIGIDPGKQVDVVDPGDQRGIGELGDLGAGHDPVRPEADGPGDMRDHCAMVARNDLDGHAERAESLDGRGRIRLRRICEDAKADHGQMGLVADGNPLLPGRNGPDGDGKQPEAVAGIARLDVRHLPLPGVVERMSQAIDLHGDAARQDGFRRPLGDQHVLAVPHRQNGQAPPLEVERHFREPSPAVETVLARRQDRVVERAPDTGLEGAVEAREAQDAIAGLVLGIDMRRQRDPCFGERAGLVHAERVHRPEIVNRRQPLDDDLSLRHAQGAAGKRHRHHHRQQLRRQADGERDREQEGLHGVTLGDQMRHQHEQREKQRQAQDQQAELPDPCSSAVGGALAAIAAAIAPKRVRLPVVTTNILPLPPTVLVPANRALVASAGKAAEQGRSDLSAGNGSPVIRASLIWSLLRLEHDAVGRYQVADAQLDDVARDERRHRDRHVLAAPDDVGLNRDRFPQRIGGETRRDAPGRCRA